jgi:DNA-binding Lrp family transcriptional regulator
VHQTFKGLSIDYSSMKTQKLLRLVSEMLKNSKKSDRELAGILGVSQPTVSRTRARIEKEYIKTYTIIPDFEKLGYQIMAFTFAKTKTWPGTDVAEELVKKSKDWLAKRPNVIFGADGEGLGKDLILISFHKKYSAYAEFMRAFSMDWGNYVDSFESFLVSIGSGCKLREFDLKYLADDL